MTDFARRLRDDQFEEHTIDAVSEDRHGWTITHGPWSFLVAREHGVMPEVGDRARFYGRGIGYTVRGLALKAPHLGAPWRVVFYRTEAEEQQRLQQERHAEQDQQRARFEQARGELDAAYCQLPTMFQRRLDVFRAANPDFRWKFEGYELFCCAEAVTIGRALKTPEAIQRFADQPFAEQRQQVPGLSNGHSGNSFGLACRLAALWVTDPAMVVAEHGALATLVGCRAYGCPHPRPAAPAGGALR